MNGREHGTDERVPDPHGAGRDRHGPAPGPVDSAATAFEDRIRDRLRADAEHLDGRTQSRLAQARHAALAELEVRPRSFRVPGFWLPAGATACALALVTVVWLRTPTPAPAAPVAQEVRFVEDLALLAARDEPEMYADDLDFYEWAEGVESTGGTRG